MFVIGHRGSRRRVNSVSSMREWAVRAQLDPNDPANADLFDYIKVYFFINWKGDLCMTTFLKGIFFCKLLLIGTYCLTFFTFVISCELKVFFLRSCHIYP